MSDDGRDVRAVLEHMPESVAVYERDGCVVYLNAASERLMGLRLDQVRGRRLWDVFPEAVGNPFHQAFQRVAAGGPAEVFEHYYLPWDRWFANRVSLVGERVHVLARDVTDDVRRRAEADSLRSRLAAVTDSNPALVSFVDRDERYQYVNATYERWLGRPRQEFLGRRLLDVLGPQAYRTIEPYVRQVLAGTPVRYQTAIAYPSGTRHVDAHYTPMRDAAGTVEGFAATVLDTSAEARLTEHERARLEAERRATRRLESLLALTGRLGGASDADQIARVVVDEAVEAVAAVRAGMWMLSTDRRELVLQRHRGFPPEELADVARLGLERPGPLADCVATGQPVWIDSRADHAARYPDGEGRPVAAAGRPFALAALPLTVERRAVGCIGFTFHDEQRPSADERTYLEVLASHAAEALRRARLYAELREVSETRQAMIQASPAAIMLLDRDGIVHSWNPAAERIFGWTAAEVLGRDLPAGSEERRTELLANVAHVLAGNVISGLVTRRPRKSGDWCDVELYAAPIRHSHGRPLCLSMLFDVSDRTRIERGRRLVAEASALLTRSLDWERTLAQVTSLPLRDFADGCAVELRSAKGPPLRIAAGVAFGRTSLRSVVAVPLAVGDRVLGTLSVGSLTRDFDDLDRTVLVELASHAAAAIDNARLYQEARAARADAEAASSAKDQFLAMLSHELRNPLAPITTALHLMRLRAPAVMDRERAVIERQVAHLSRLVDDLLDVSRITRGKVELRRERTTLAAAVARAIEIASPLLEQRRHQLVVDVPPDLAVHGDPTRLGQVVANLLSNAAKYTEVGGHIEVRAERKDGQVVLTVRDDGIGIAPEMLPVVFDLFVQAPQSSARTGGGLGLGLAIVRSLVELHGGSVSAHSDGAGAGTEARVRLPVASEALMTVPRPAAAAAAHAAQPRRVLVVDDNQDAAALLGELLDAHGHQIRTAFDGPSALRIAEEFRPEIAVLDIGLPVMDGYELAQRLRTSLGLAPLRLIAVSGYGQETDRARAREAGFDAHLAKPVPAEALVRLVEDGPAH